MAGISLIYNGVDLSQWFDVTDVQRNVGTAHTNTMVKVGQSDGQLWQYMSRDAKTITITGIIANANLANLRRELGAAIDTDEPQQLIIGDDSDVYYLAIYDGQPTIAEGWRSGTVSLSFIVPDGIAHSVATQTADNMPYKDVPVNFVIASHASGSNTTSKDAYPIHMQLSEDLSGKTITTVAKFIVTNYQGKVDSTNSMGPYIDVKDGISTGYWAGLINQIPITGNGVYTSSPQTMTKHPLTGTANHIDVEMYNLNATIEIWIKLEIGTSASPWSPNPADPEYYTNTITVQNAGSYKSYPVITATMSGDNGYLGLASSSGGYLEFGDAESPDKVTGTRSDRSLWWDYRSSPAGSNINTSCVTAYPYRLNDSKYPNAFDGSFKFGQDPGAEVATPVWASNSSAVWHGPAIHGDIAANINGIRTGYFTFANRVDFKPTTKGMGRVEYNLENNGASGISAVIRDSITTSINRTFECIVGTLSATVKVLKSYTIPKTWGSFLEVKITRSGNTITWQVSEVGSISRSWRWSTTMTTLGAMEITGMTAWMQKYSNNTALDIDLTDTQFTWQNETVVTDIPNLFADGDMVTIDTNNKVILVNGVEDRSLQEIGNHWDDFYLTPGANTITVDGSSWATQPAVTIYYQEAYV